METTKITHASLPDADVVIMAVLSNARTTQETAPVRSPSRTYTKG